MITRQTESGATENIGTVTQVYDGALTSDVQVNTFRHIDRLFPVRIVKRGPSVHTLAKSDKPLTHLEFSSGGKIFDLVDSTVNQGAFRAWGIFGQHIYVNPRERVVIVVWSALPKPTGKDVIPDEDFFAAAAAALG